MFTASKVWSCAKAGKFRLAIESIKIFLSHDSIHLFSSQCFIHRESVCYLRVLMSRRARIANKTISKQKFLKPALLLFRPLHLNV